ncbi:CopG family transcriptional regulator [Streptomyces acidicola]|uniref:CopG family transcriptional regulator n=1 Tax=Streptomyces acidicola TaxID=2596892 RepID=A0A5N8X0N8_9ACTN|nr:CopG family transcriptional regulator [Streptomyces acidicola]MPY52398.1 CopG family transcriptional regulator [Streptomyces acidicola]
MSAYVTEALHPQQDRDVLRELVDWLEEEHGPITASENAAVREELRGLAAEHAQRRGRTAGQGGEGGLQ